MSDKITLAGKTIHEVALEIYRTLCNMEDSERQKQLKIYQQCFTAVSGGDVLPVKHP